jgi:hypothetical protein
MCFNKCNRKKTLSVKYSMIKSFSAKEMAENFQLRLFEEDRKLSLGSIWQSNEGCSLYNAHGLLCKLAFCPYALVHGTNRMQVRKRYVFY